MVLERARSFANEAMWRIALQRRRIRSDEPEDGELNWKEPILLVAADGPFYCTEMRPDDEQDDLLMNFVDTIVFAGRTPSVAERQAERDSLVVEVYDISAVA